MRKNWKPVSSADFDQNYEPISPSYPGFAATTYTVKSGDTLQSIARAVWGDADMWYLIADANGLTNSNTLTAGQVLTIPNKVTNIHNNSGTYRVYNPGEAIGDVNPTLPTAPPVPRKKKKCGGIASILVAVVTIAVSVVVTAYGIPPVYAAALGNVAGQATGNVLGVQKGFDFKSFATSVATAAVLDYTPVKDAIGKLAGTVGNAVGSNYAAVAARAVVGNVVNQGIGNITGSQKGFSWSSVAIAGVGAAASAAMSDKFKLSTTDAQGVNTPVDTKLGTDFARAATTASSFALTQLVVKGGKINWQQVATDTVTNLIQNRGESKERDAAVQKWFDGLTRQEKDVYLKSSLASNDDPRVMLRPDGESPWGEGYQVAVNGKASGLGKGAKLSGQNADLPFTGGEDFNNYFLSKKAEMAWWTNAAKVNNTGELLVNPLTGQEDFSFTNVYRSEYKANELANSPKMEYGNYELRDANNNPSISINQARQNFNQSLEKGIVGGTTAGATFLASPYFGARTVMALTGTMDVGGQYYLSDKSKPFFEQYKLAQTLFSMATAGASVKVGGFVTSSSKPWLNTLNSGLLGGTVSYINTAFTNAYYNENKDPNFSFGLGFGFGAAGSYLGGLSDKALSTVLVNPNINRNIPILYQSYSNPRADYWGNAVLGTTISNISSYIDTPEKKR